MELLNFREINALIRLVSALDEELEALSADAGRQENKLQKAAEAVRMKDVRASLRQIPVGELRSSRAGIRVKALFDRNQKWRLAEEFGPDSVTETEDGKLLFTADYTDLDNLVTWLLTFKDKAEVLEPIEARKMIAEAVKRMSAIYEE